MTEYSSQGYDFNADPVKNWLNTIIWQIKICEELIFNQGHHALGLRQIVYTLRGLFALLDETGKNKFKQEIDLLYKYEENHDLVSSYPQIERMFSDAMTYLNSTIFKEMRGVKPLNPSPDHIRGETT